MIRLSDTYTTERHLNQGLMFMTLKKETLLGETDMVLFHLQSLKNNITKNHCMIDYSFYFIKIKFNLLSAIADTF